MRRKFEEKRKEHEKIEVEEGISLERENTFVTMESWSQFL